MVENYVRPTIKNCISALKPTGLYGVNIVNFWQGGKKYMVAEDWLRIAKEEGLILQGIFPFRKLYSRQRPLYYPQGQESGHHTQMPFLSFSVR